MVHLSNRDRIHRRSILSAVLVVSLLAAAPSARSESVENRAAAERAPGEVSDPQNLPALIESLRGSRRPLLDPATPALLRMGRSAVRPLLELLGTKPHGHEFEALLHLLNHGDILDVCLEIMADGGEEPAFRMKVGEFAQGFVGQESIGDELADLYKALYKDPASSHQIRTQAGKSLDSRDQSRPDQGAGLSFEYRFRKPGAASAGAASSYFLGRWPFSVMLSALDQPKLPVLEELTGFLSGIEVLRTFDGLRGSEIGTVLLGAAKHPSPRVRTVVAAFLPYLDEPARIPTLSALAEDGDATVRAEAARGLKLLEEPAGSGQGPRPADAGTAGGAPLRELSDQEIAAVLRRISNEKSGNAVDSQVRTIAQGGPDMVDRLAPYLSGTDASLQVGAAVALGALGDDRAVKPLVAVVVAKSEEARPTISSGGEDRTQIAATMALGRLKAREAFDELRRLFAPETEKTFLLSLARTLGEIDETEAASAFKAAVFSEDRWLREAAVEGLSSISEPVARETVASLLGDPVPANQKSGLTILTNQVQREKIDAGRVPEGYADLLAHGIAAEDTCNLVMASSLLARLGLTEPFLVALEEKDLGVLEEHYPLYVMLGIEGSETTLAEVLSGSDTVDMYLVYKHCGNKSLKSAAEEWAREAVHARDIDQSRKLRCVVRWGQTQPGPAE